MAEFSNPFLRGMLGAQEAAQRGGMAQVQTLGGLLSIQDALETKPLQREQLRMAVENAKANMARRQQLMGGASPQSGGQPETYSPAVASAFGMPQGAPIPQSNGGGGNAGGAYSGIPREVMADILSDPNGLAKLAQEALKIQTEREKIVSGRPGAPMWGRDAQGNPTVVGFNPKTIEGQTMSPTGVISTAPGFLDSASELGKIPLEKVTNSDQTVSYIPRASLIRPPAAAGPSIPQAVPQAQPSPREIALAGRSPQELAAIQAVESGQVPRAEVPASQLGVIKPRSVGFGGAPTFGQTQEEQIRQAGMTAANTEAGKEFIKEQANNFAKLRDVPASLANIEKAKSLASGNAAKFMGPLGETKLEITKFMRANMPGMSTLATPNVTGAEEIRAALFNQVMDNLKKMDAQPSQYQQQVMQDAFGKLGTDPAAIPAMLDVFADILRTKVDIHNQTVTSAEARGTQFPYDVKIKIPPKQGAGGTNPQAIVDEMRRRGLIK